MLVEAVFVGTDGSLGLRHGRSYSIRITENCDGSITIGWLTYDWLDGWMIRACEYSSWDTFYENWWRA